MKRIDEKKIEKLATYLDWVAKQLNPQADHLQEQIDEEQERYDEKGERAQGSDKGVAQAEMIEEFKNGMDSLSSLIGLMYSAASSIRNALGVAE